MCPNDLISIILTAIEPSALELMLGAFATHLHYARLVSGRVEQNGGREIGHDEAANKAEDGEMSATRRDEAKQPGLKRGAAIPHARWEGNDN